VRSTKESHYIPDKDKAVGTTTDAGEGELQLLDLNKQWLLELDLNGAAVERLDLVGGDGLREKGWRGRDL
jgi:hypothetical protein